LVRTIAPTWVSILKNNSLPNCDPLVTIFIENPVSGIVHLLGISCSDPALRANDRSGDQTDFFQEVIHLVRLQIVRKFQQK
jgi:hypothetical protein